MAAEPFVDPYLDPDTGILRNLVGARTQAELDALETDLSTARGHELLDMPPRPTGDLDEFRAIHLQLFQDVYDWAGELRTVDMRKNTAGAEFFLPYPMIERSAGYAAAELQDDDMLRGMGRERFVERLSYHYDQWNYIHPFREGNGRTQRLFWQRVAEDAGWRLDWLRTTPEENVAASRSAAEQRDLRPLQEMFARVVVDPDSPQLSGTDPARYLGQVADAYRIALGEIPPPARPRPPSVDPEAPRSSYRPGPADGQDLGR